MPKKTCCEILKYSQVYEPYRSIVGQKRGRTHRDLNEIRMNVGKLNQILTKLILIQFNKNWLFAMKYTKQIIKLSK